MQLLAQFLILKRHTLRKIQHEELGKMQWKVTKRVDCRWFRLDPFHGRFACAGSTAYYPQTGRAANWQFCQQMRQPLGKRDE